MARIRTIKPDIGESKDIAKLSLGARYFFVLLLCHLDDAGRAEWLPKKLCGAMYAHDQNITPDDLEGWLQECVSATLLLTYYSLSTQWIASPTFDKHQTINRPSKITSPPVPDDTLAEYHRIQVQNESTHDILTECSVSTPCPEKEKEKEKEKEREMEGGAGGNDHRANVSKRKQNKPQSAQAEAEAEAEAEAINTPLPPLPPVPVAESPPESAAASESVLLEVIEAEVVTSTELEVRQPPWWEFCESFEARMTRDIRLAKGYGAFDPAEHEWHNLMSKIATWGGDQDAVEALVIGFIDRANARKLKEPEYKLPLRVLLKWAESRRTDWQRRKASGPKPGMVDVYGDGAKLLHEVRSR